MCLHLKSTLTAIACIQKTVSFIIIAQIKTENKSSLAICTYFSINAPFSDLLPLPGDREGELAVFVGNDGSRTVIIQLVEIVAELEV